MVQYSLSIPSYKSNLLSLISILIPCLVFCEDLPALGNGTITYSMVVESPGQRPENTIATYMCDDGFLLMGSQERVCSNNGEYNEMAPTCERKFVA